MSIKNMIRRLLTTAIQKDDGVYPQTQVEIFDQTRNVSIIIPYGLLSSAPVNGDGVAFQLMGQEENLAAIVGDPVNRKKGLKEGETGLENSKTKTFILLKEDGGIEVDVKGDYTVNIDGNKDVTIGGNVNLTVTGTTTLTTTGAVTWAAPAGVAITGPVSIIGTLSVSGVATVGALAVTGGAGASTLAGTINNTATISGAGTIASAGVTLSSHVHTGVTAGGSNTGGPI